MVKIGVAKKVLEDAIKEGYLNLKPTNYGDQVSLNFERREDITTVIEALLEN